MLPMIGRWSDAKVFDETADRVARLAMMAADGKPHNNPFYPPTIGYPTRKNTEELLRTALGAVDDPDPLAAGRGFALQDIFAGAWERIDADEGEDQGAKDALPPLYAQITEGEEDWLKLPELERAVLVLASFAETSLWVTAVQAAYPLHPQTPGSPKWLAAEAAGNPHETVGNPFLRKR